MMSLPVRSKRRKNHTEKKHSKRKSIRSFDHYVPSVGNSLNSLNEKPIVYFFSAVTFPGNSSSKFATYFL